MKELNFKSRYQFISLLRELLYFFISSFILFPSHVKRIILCFVYSEDYQPSFISPYLEEESLQPPYVVDVDPISFPQPVHKDEHCIQISLETDQPCNHENDEFESKSSQISLLSPIPPKPCFQPTEFQSKIRQRVFKPLKLPAHLHPYPPYFVEYLPHFTGESHVSAEKHLEAFENFIDNLEIVHEDIVMRLFSKSLTREAALWFRLLEPGSIGSWTDFYYVFSKHWGENKCLDQYLNDFCTLKREKEESLTVFNRRFHRTYYDIPLEIRPTEIAAMVYYLMAQHNELVLLLLERKSSSLGNLFEDAQEVEENIRASRRIQQQVDFDNLLAHEQKQCQYGSDSEQEGNECEADLEQQKAYELISDSDLNSSTLAECSRDREQEGDQFSRKGTAMVEQERNEVGADLGQQPTCKFNSVSGSDFSIFAEYSRDRYACEAYDQFVSQEEPMMTDDCIINYMFSAEPNPCDGNLVLLSSCQHHSDNEIVVFDDHELISRGQEDDQSSCRGTVMAEQEAAIDVQLFPEEQHVSYLLFKDPVAAFMELHFSEGSKVSDFFNSPMFSGKYGFLKSSLSLWLHVQHHLLISNKDKISSVFKLLGWLLWKSTFT
jgi:hypothetical protein